ncbi:MAG TPA: preprotein translocase subunit SecE [Candidatus Angelobacter sp.]|nr:preprotein translocase subunit SecE [Candidatus Angelobacter sp.]
MAKAVAMTRDEQSLGGKLKAWPARTKGFFSDVRNEMRKVTFPSRKEVRATTIVVIVTVFLFALYFWLIDLLIGNGINWVLNRLAK